MTPNRVPDAKRVNGVLAQSPVKGSDASSRMGIEAEITNALRCAAEASHRNAPGEKNDPRRIPA
jgi:hypothetical protein